MQGISPARGTVPAAGKGRNVGAGWDSANPHLTGSPKIQHFPNKFSAFL